MHLNLPYGPHARHRLDLYTLKDPTLQRGLVIYLYGGSWRKGDRKLYRFLASTLNRQGFAVAIPDYRVFPEIRYPDFMDDAAAAIAWLNKNAATYNIPLNRLFLMGHSAGAHMGALLLTNPSFLAAHELDQHSFDGFIGLAGPYTFNPLHYKRTQAIFESADPIDQALPTEHISGSEPPMLLLHGAADTTVYPHNSTQLETLLQDAGSDATSIVYPNVGHVGILTAVLPPLRWRAPVWRDTLAFLDTHASEPRLLDSLAS